ncbi:hypothetical protein BDW71DRAFT_203663 [Aspergillus fruticulosus]
MKKLVDTPLGQSLSFVARHRKELIALIIRERIFPSRAVSTEGSQLGSIFPASQYREAQKVRPDSAEIEQIMDEADPETNISDVPPSLAELDLPNITETLCNGEPYWGAYKELKSVAFPAPAQELKRVLQAQIPDDYSENVVNCMIQWEDLELMDSGEIMKTDLDSVLTLTGTFDHTSVCRREIIYTSSGAQAGQYLVL